MSFSKKDNYYILDGRELMPSAILAEVQKLDDEKRGKLLLDEKVAEKLNQLFWSLPKFNWVVIKKLI